MTLLLVSRTNSQRLVWLLALLLGLVFGFGHPVPVVHAGDRVASVSQGKKVRKAAARKTAKRKTVKRKTAKKKRAHSRHRRVQDRLTATAAVVLEPANGDIIFQQQPMWLGQPASTIKLLTAMVAMQELQGFEQIEVSTYAASQPRSKLYLQPGHTYLSQDLLYATLLHSANDAAVALAEAVSGSEEAFADRMTALARDIGAKNTVCRTATGLTAHGQYTTAYDLALILNAAMENPRIAYMLQCRRAMACKRTIRSHNKALWQIPGALGGKTGYTAVAGRTYVGSFERNGRQVIIAFLGSENLWGDLRLLARKAFEGQDGPKRSAGRREETRRSRVASKQQDEAG